MRGFEDVAIDWAPRRLFETPTGQHTTLTFIVPGSPVQKGNVIRGRWGGYHDSTVGLAQWDAICSHQADAAMKGAWRTREGGSSGPLDQFMGAVAVEARFVMPRGKTTKINGVLWNLTKALTPPFTKAPDADKLFRSIGDAMTGIVYHDDAQIVDLRARKRFADLGETPGAWIRVTDWVEMW